MPGLLIVITHVMVFRQVAASNVSANQANPQVQPIIIELYAFGAGLIIAWRNLLREIDM